MGRSARSDRWGPCSFDGSGPSNVRLGEILALEQQRLAACADQGIGSAVAKIQPRRMAAFAEAPKGQASDVDPSALLEHGFTVGAQRSASVA